MVSSDARNRPRVAVDSAGAAFVSGFEVDLIATPSGQSGFVERAWLNKLSPQGDALVYRRTLLGARGTAVAVDSLGNAYFAGIFGIGGLDADYTPTAGALNQPGGPGFLMKLSPGGELLYAARLAAAPVGRLTPIGLMFSQLCR
jgi:hypothetical protein